MQPVPFDLTTFPFTEGSDEVHASGTLTIDSAAGSPFRAIYNEGTVDALAGDDLIEGALDGTVSALRQHLEIIAIDNPGTTVTGLGDDTVSATLDFSVDPNAVPDMPGIFGQNAQFARTGLIDTGGGNDTVESDVRISGSGDSTEAWGIYYINIATGDGSDRVTGEVNGRVHSAQGIGYSNIETGAGEDLVSGRAAISTGQYGGSGWGIHTGESRIDTGDDADYVLGEVELEVQAGPRGIAWGGITGSGSGGTVATGGGGDLVVGRSIVTAGQNGSYSAYGIGQVTIETGDGSDRVLAEVVATLAGQDDPNLFPSQAIASPDATILTGDGDDVVVASVETSSGDGVGRGFGGKGFSFGTIDTGTGDDLVLGQVTERAGDNPYLGNAEGIRDTDIKTGLGRDSVYGIASQTGGVNANLGGVDGIADATIMTDGDDDRVAGASTTRGGAGSRLLDNDGITGGTIDSGEGSDLVFGQTDVGGGTGSYLSGNDGIEGAQITTGEGNDVVAGVSTIGGDAPLAAFGDGLHGPGRTIDTGAGDDLVGGIGAEVAIGGGTSEGIEGYTLALGDGNDLVFARGATAGVKDVVINGGAGDDRFDLHSGTGTVDGGDDVDGLLLSGDRDDFTFTAEAGGVRITDNGLPNSTDLLVLNVEFFGFDDQVATFDELIA